MAWLRNRAPSWGPSQRCCKCDFLRAASDTLFSDRNPGNKRLSLVRALCRGSPGTLRGRRPLAGSSAGHCPVKAGQGGGHETGHRTQAYPRRATSPGTCPRAPLQEAVEATCLGSGRSSKEGGAAAGTQPRCRPSRLGPLPLTARGPQCQRHPTHS